MIDRLAQDRTVDRLIADWLFDGVRDKLTHDGLLMNWMTFDVLFKAESFVGSLFDRKTNG